MKAIIPAQPGWHVLWPSKDWSSYRREVVIAWYVIEDDDAMDEYPDGDVDEIYVMPITAGMNMKQLSLAIESPDGVVRYEQLSWDDATDWLNWSRGQ